MFAIGDITPTLLRQDEVVFFSDIPNAGSLANLSADKKAALVAAAEAALADDFPVIPASTYMEVFTSAGLTFANHFDKTYYKRRRMIFSLLLGECVECKGRFVDRLIDDVWLVLEETSWVAPEHARNNYHRPFQDRTLPSDFAGDLEYVDHCAAETGALLAQVLYFAGAMLDDVTPIITERIRYELQRRIVAPFLRYDDMHWMGLADNRKLNNWSPWCVSNILTVCALVVRETNVRSQMVGRASKILDRFIAGYGDDGGCDEGPHYWGAAAGSYFDSLELVYDLTGGAISLFHEALVTKLCQYIAHVHIAGRAFVNFADCPPSLDVDYIQVARMGRRCGDKLLLRFGTTQIDKSSYDIPAQTFALRFIKDLFDDYPVDLRLPEMPERSWLPDVEVLTLRENRVPGKGMFLCVKGGSNAESHNHNDVGSFVVWYEGHPVFIDPGVETYTARTFSRERYHIWTMQSSYHNLPEINGVMQAAGDEFAASDVLYAGQSAIQMDIGGAYPANAGVQSLWRSVSLQDGRVEVNDIFVLDSPGYLVWNLVTADPPDISLPGTIQVGGCTATYDASMRPSVEEIALKDDLLAEGWARRILYRIRIVAQAPQKTGDFLLSIEGTTK